MSTTGAIPNEIARTCNRFLSGHGRPRLADTLAGLAREAQDDEPDTYGAGALIERFEETVAAALGKERALFLPSGTMAQQIALRIHCDRARLRTVAFHPTCHLELHEQRGYAALHGLHARLAGERTRLLSADDLPQIAEPIAALLLELPQREIGGQLPPWQDLERQIAWARARSVATHMDGARLWEAAPYYGRSPAAIASLFDSVYVSFYKGLGAIAGAALAGPAPFIAEARVWQRRHGGNLVSLAPLVVSARAALRRRGERFLHYHQRAVEVAQALAAVPGISVQPDPPHTNMMHVYLSRPVEHVAERAAAIAARDRVLLLRQARPADAPGTSWFELAIGDAADALTNEEIARYAAEMMA